MSKKVDGGAMKMEDSILKKIRKELNWKQRIWFKFHRKDLKKIYHKIRITVINEILLK